MLKTANWLRVSLDLSARYDRRLKVTLHAESVTALQDILPDPEQSGVPESGLAWRVELIDGAHAASPDAARPIPLESLRFRCQTPVIMS